MALEAQPVRAEVFVWVNKAFGKILNHVMTWKLWSQLGGHIALAAVLILFIE